MTVSRYFTFQSKQYKINFAVRFTLLKKYEVCPVFSIAVVSTTDLACVFISFCYFLCYVVLSVTIVSGGGVTKHLNRPIYCVAEIYTYKLVTVYLSKVKCGLEVQKQADDKSLFSNAI